MKKTLFKISLFVVPVVLGISMVLVLNTYQNNFNTAKFLLEAENDYRLKFVDSTDYELMLGETSKVLLPFEILNAEEVEGSIILTTYENSVILAPVDSKVLSVSNNELELGSGNITCVLSGVISGVKAGNELSVGDVLGTVKGTTCSIKVFWGTRKLSLEELKSLL